MQYTDNHANFVSFTFHRILMNFLTLAPIKSSKKLFFLLILRKNNTSYLIYAKASFIFIFKCLA